MRASDAFKPARFSARPQRFRSSTIIGGKGDEDESGVEEEDEGEDEEEDEDADEESDEEEEDNEEDEESSDASESEVVAALVPDSDAVSLDDSRSVTAPSLRMTEKVKRRVSARH